MIGLDGFGLIANKLWVKERESAGENACEVGKIISG